MAATLAIAAVYGAACSSPPDESADVDPALAGVVYQGNATSKALASMLAATPITDAAMRPRIVAPPPNTVTVASEVLTFEWGPGGTEALHLLPVERPLVPRWLADLLGPERAAAAAPVATSGRGYYLLFATPEDAALLRIFTTKTSYTPDKKAWDILRSAGMWTKLTLTAADFSGDAMLPASGPYVADFIEFCIEPG